MAIDWDRHIRLFENPDGTVWLRILQDDRQELSQLSRQFFDHESLFVSIKGEVILVRYDPSESRARTRARESPKLKPLDGKIYTVGPALIWRSVNTQIWEYPTIGARNLAKNSQFLNWAFSPETGVKFAPTRIPMSVGKIYLHWGSRQKDQGTPLFNLSIYHMLGISTPITLPEPEFLEWVKEVS